MNLETRGNSFSFAALKKNDTSTMLCVVALVLLCVNPGYFEGHDCMNLLLNTFMCLSPLAFLIKGTRVIIPRLDLPLGIVILCVILFPLIFHPESVRWATMLFTCAYCIFFLVFARLLRISSFDAKLLNATIRWIIYAYFIVLLIQQFCTFFDLPIFMKGQKYYIDYPYKLNSLSAEPSHTTQILSVIMMFYSLTRTHTLPNLTLWNEIKGNYPVWICYFYVIFTTINASAFIFWILSVLPFINKKNWYWFAGIILLIVIAVNVTSLRNMPLIKRAQNTLVALPTMNDQNLLEADPSAAMRIAPSIWAFKTINFGESDNYVGHGADAVYRELPQNPFEKNSRSSGGIFTLWYNYGFICSLALWVAIFLSVVIGKQWVTWIAFLLAIQLSSDYNMQLLWMLMAFGLVYKYSIFGDKRLLSILNLNPGHA